MQCGALTFPDGVGPVRVREHHKLFVVRDELIDELGHALVVHIVIHRAMNQQQFPFKIFRVCDRRTILVALDIILGQPHVAFLIDSVVQALIRHRRNGDANMIEIGKLEHRVECH